MNRDLGVTELIRTTLPEWTIRLFELTAALGDELVIVGAVSLLAIVDAYGSVRRGSDRLVSKRMGVLVAIVLGGLALTLILKTAFGFSRPPSSLQAVPREGEGFPSGHTMAAVVFWGALVRWSERFSVEFRLTGASIVVALVGFSRLALGVHYLVDVLASVGFGIAYLAIAAVLAGNEPVRAFAGATLLGVLAVLVTGLTIDGWLAFIGCVGGAAGWWVITRPSVQNAWSVTT